jgi:hypothetical protein
MSEPTRSPLSPFCSCLRSKKLQYLSRPALSESDVLDVSGRTWCKLTMDSLGPDGRIVDPEDCRPGRKCFEAWGARTS